ncbi:hypothetical protein V9L05_19985 [Bernardetia sp. Wsw4-3y2]
MHRKQAALISHYQHIADPYSLSDLEFALRLADTEWLMYHHLGLKSKK